jgi:hypothetical protein
LPPVAYRIKHIHRICALPGQANYGNYTSLNGVRRTFFQIPAATFRALRCPYLYPLQAEKFKPAALRLDFAQLAMKQYVIDELRLNDHYKIRQYLDETYGPAELGGIYWVPLAAKVLTEIQLEHSACQPFYFAIEVEKDRLSIEMLVRTKNRIRCACIGYASKDQRIWIMDVVDAIIEKLNIAT